MSTLRARSEQRWLLTIMGAALVLRIGAALYLDAHALRMPGIADQHSYHALALRVIDGHGFSFDTGWWPATPAGQPTAHWSYLYVLFLAGAYWIAGPMTLAPRLAQAVLVGVLQPLLAYRVTSRLFGPRVGLIGAALTAGYAYFVYYAGALMTESFFIVAVLWSLDVALRIGGVGETSRPATLRLWLQLGIAAAAAALLRQAVLIVIPVVLLWAAWRALRREQGTAVRRLTTSHPLAGVALAVIVLGVTILPWTIRNQRAFGEFVLLNTNAGFAFYWGNHPIHGTRFVPILGTGDYGRLIPAELRGLNEAQLDKALLTRGLAFVVADPVRFVQLSISRLREFIRFWPGERPDRVADLIRLLSFGLLVPFFAAGIPLALADARRSHLPMSARTAGLWLLLASAGVYSLVHLLTWTLVRYRLPVDAVLMPFAACAMAWASDRVFAGGGLLTPVSSSSRP